MSEILFVDACPRTTSRTRQLADQVLKHLEGQVTTLKLSELDLPTIDEAAADKRGKDSKAKDFSDSIYDLPKQFAEADTIVIAAPFWDMSFPALLKKYLEAITVSGITFYYSENGVPVGLCKANKLYYVTTAGGPIFNQEFGYGYVQTLATGMYGITDCQLFKAENLDIIGADVPSIMAEAEEQVDKYFN